MDDSEDRRRRLLYRSRRRGTKEADILLGGFAAAHLGALSEDDVRQFEALLEESDPDLMRWIGGIEEPPQRYVGLLKLIVKLKCST
jgi:antitoxin CptB